MALVEDLDYGTPARRSDQTVTLTIDSRRTTVPAGTSVMRAAVTSLLVITAVNHALTVWMS